MEDEKPKRNPQSSEVNVPTFLVGMIFLVLVAAGICIILLGLNTPVKTCNWFDAAELDQSTLPTTVAINQQSRGFGQVAWPIQVQFTSDIPFSLKLDGDEQYSGTMAVGDQISYFVTATIYHGSSWTLKANKGQIAFTALKYQDCK